MDRTRTFTPAPRRRSLREWALIGAVLAAALAASRLVLGELQTWQDENQRRASWPFSIRET